MSEKKYCDICDKSVEKYNWKNHINSKGHDIKVRTKKAREEHDLKEAECYVYVILVEPTDTQGQYYYVGLADEPLKRVEIHAKSVRYLNFPTENRKETVKSEYNFVDLVEIETCDSREHARVREREKLAEVAREYDVDYILGGK